MEYRVQGSAKVEYKSRKLSRDDIIKRRAAMRKILINSIFNNSSNEVLDSLRIERTGTGYYIVEDLQGYETIIGYKLKNVPNDATNIDKDK